MTINAATPTRVALKVLKALESMGVPAFVAGSLASALHGVPRSTNDADIVANLFPGHTVRLVERLGDEFHLDRVEIELAIQHRRCFNLLHRDTLFRVDVFVSSQSPFERAQMNRREFHQLADRQVAAVASMEDTILAKLRWFRDGGEVSERQWRDVQEILQLSAGNMDDSYLQHWATELGITELLARALSQSRNP